MSDELFSVKMKELRESTGLNRKEFCEKFEIPYRTMTEWELGHRKSVPIENETVWLSQTQMVELFDRDQ